MPTLRGVEDIIVPARFPRYDTLREKYRTLKSATLGPTYQPGGSL